MYPSPFGTPVHASHPGACASVPRPQVSTGWLVSCPLNALEGVWLFVMCQPSQYLAVWMNQRPTVDFNMVRILWTMMINFLSTEEDVSIVNSGHCIWKKCLQVCSELYISWFASWCFDPWEWNIYKCTLLQVFLRCLPYIGILVTMFKPANHLLNDHNLNHSLPCIKQKSSFVVSRKNFTKRAIVNYFRKQSINPFKVVKSEKNNFISTISEQRLFQSMK